MVPTLETLLTEGLKAVPNLLVALITLGLGWLVGQRLTLSWNLRQKRRELDLSNAKEFQALYGEFFAVWKLWNYYTRDIGDKSLPGASRWELLNRACAAEAGMESIFVRLASERNLSDTQVESLGQFRQLYQTLREVIRDNKPLRWDHSEHPEYVKFKRLGAEVAYFIVTDTDKDKAAAGKHADALIGITANRHEDRRVLGGT
jgi:mechanosensitive ion channel-like protein